MKNRRAATWKETGLGRDLSRHAWRLLVSQGRLGLLWSRMKHLFIIAEKEINGIVAPRRARSAA